MGRSTIATSASACEGPSRGRRYRRKASEITSGITVTAADIRALAGQLETHMATPADQQLAARFVLTFLHMMPADFVLRLPGGTHDSFPRNI
jgi:hypothetical protein